MNSFSETDGECTQYNSPHYFGFEKLRNVFCKRREKNDGKIIRVQENLANYSATSGDCPGYFSVLFTIVLTSLYFPKHYWMQNNWRKVRHFWQIYQSEENAKLCGLFGIFLSCLQENRQVYIFQNTIEWKINDEK